MCHIAVDWGRLLAVGGLEEKLHRQAPSARSARPMQPHRRPSLPAVPSESPLACLCSASASSSVAIASSSLPCKSARFLAATSSARGRWPHYARPVARPLFRGMASDTEILASEIASLSTFLPPFEALHWWRSPCPFSSRSWCRRGPCRAATRRGCDTRRSRLPWRTWCRSCSRRNALQLLRALRLRHALVSACSV